MLLLDSSPRSDLKDIKKVSQLATLLLQFIQTKFHGVQNIAPTKFDLDALCDVPLAQIDS